MTLVSRLAPKLWDLKNQPYTGRSGATKLKRWWNILKLTAYQRHSNIVTKIHCYINTYRQTTQIKYTYIHNYTHKKRLHIQSNSYKEKSLINFVTFTTLPFHPYPPKINEFGHMRLLPWQYAIDIAIHIGHAIDIKLKSILFIKQLSGKFPNIDFHWNVEKRDFTKIFIFLLKFQLIRINVLVMIFKFVIIENT